MPFENPIPHWLPSISYSKADSRGKCSAYRLLSWQALYQCIQRDRVGNGTARVSGVPSGKSQAYAVVDFLAKKLDGENPVTSAVPVMTTLAPTSVFQPTGSPSAR